MVGRPKPKPPRLVSHALVEELDQQRADVDRLLQRCALLSSGVSAVSASWQAQRGQIDAILDQVVVAAFPAHDQQRLTTAAHELIIAAAGKQDCTPQAQGAAAGVRARLLRHGAIGIEAGADASGICSIKRASLRHYPKALSGDKRFQTALARALMPLAQFFRPARDHNQSGAMSSRSGLTPRPPAEGGPPAEGAGAATARSRAARSVAHAPAREQSFDAFATSGRKLGSRNVVVVVAMGRSLPLELACIAAETARAMSGVEVVVLEAELPRRMSNHFVEDLLAAGLDAQQSAQRQLGSARHVVATLVLVRAALEISAERRTSGTATLVSVAAPTAGHRRQSAPDSAALSDPRRQAVARLIARTNQALARLLGVEACRTYRCSLAAEAHNTCAHLCPICLRKVLWMAPASLSDYYARQRALFCRAAEGCSTRFAPELEWLEKRTRFLFEDEDAPDVGAGRGETPTRRRSVPTVSALSFTADGDGPGRRPQPALQPRPPAEGRLPQVLQRRTSV